VEVSLNGVDFSTSGRRFEYVHSAEIITVSPTSGVIGGGTDVIVTGENFIASHNLRCRFGENEVPAEYMQSNKLKCTTPPGRDGEVVISVSNNKLDFESSTTFFRYADLPVIGMVSHRNVSMSGNSTVVVNGVGFTGDDSMSCLFQYYDELAKKNVSQIVMVKSQNNTSLECNAPTINPGDALEAAATLSISRNSQEFSSPYEMRYIRRPKLTGVFPKHIQPGLLSIVNITGGMFVNTFDLFCHYSGGIPSHRAVFVSETELRCGVFIPLSWDTFHSEITIRVTNNIQEMSLEKLRIRVLATPKVLLYSPRLGSENGHTAVKIKGSGFSMNNYTCEFGNVLVPGEWRDENTIFCISPPHAPESNLSLSVIGHAGKLPFSNDNLEDMSFSYFATYTISSFFPQRGTTKGSTQVTLSGTGFFDAAGLSCKFGSVTVPATFKSSVSLACMSPPHSEGFVKLSVSMNGQDYQHDLFNFSYEAPASVQSVNPTYGPLNGGITVIVVGEGFKATGVNLLCRFGENVTTFARYITPTKVSCVLPPGQVGIIAVEVTTNGEEYSADGVQFSYRQSAIVHTVFPTIGPTTGGTQIVVRGEHFSNMGNLTCKF
jgi:hypothetical protein